MICQQPRNSSGPQWWSASFGLIVSFTLKEQRNLSKHIYSFEATFGYLLPVIKIFGTEHWRLNFQKYFKSEQHTGDKVKRASKLLHLCCCTIHLDVTNFPSLPWQISDMTLWNYGSSSSAPWTINLVSSQTSVSALLPWCYSSPVPVHPVPFSSAPTLCFTSSCPVSTSLACWKTSNCNFTWFSASWVVRMWFRLSILCLAPPKIGNHYFTVYFSLGCAWTGIHLHCSPVSHPSACVAKELKL